MNEPKMKSIEELAKIEKSRAEETLKASEEAVSTMDVLHARAHRDDRYREDARQERLAQRRFETDESLAEHAQDAARSPDTFSWDSEDEIYFSVHTCPEETILRIATDGKGCGYCDQRVNAISTSLQAEVAGGRAKFFDTDRLQGSFLKLPPIPEGEDISAYLSRVFGRKVRREE